MVSTSQSVPNRSVEVVRGVGRDARGTSDLRFVGAVLKDEPRVVTGADP